MTIIDNGIKTMSRLHYYYYYYNYYYYYYYYMHLHHHYVVVVAAVLSALSAIGIVIKTINVITTSGHYTMLGRNMNDKSSYTVSL